MSRKLAFEASLKTSLKNNSVIVKTRVQINKKCRKLYMYK